MSHSLYASIAPYEIVVHTYERTNYSSASSDLYMVDIYVRWSINKQTNPNDLDLYKEIFRSY